MIDLIWVDFLEYCFFRKMSLRSALQSDDHGFAFEPLVQASIRGLAGHPFKY